MEELTKEQIAEFFDYLDDLRSSGETNMFGAASYLSDEFLLTRPVARQVLIAWMESDLELSPEERAKQVVAKRESK